MESQVFSLQSSNSSVALQLLRRLDRETTDFFSLRLLATDRGSPALIGETTINITVLVRQKTLLQWVLSPDCQGSVELWRA